METEGQRSPLKKHDPSCPIHIADPRDCEHLYAIIEELQLTNASISSWAVDEPLMDDKACYSILTMDAADALPWLWVLEKMSSFNAKNCLRWQGVMWNTKLNKNYSGIIKKKLRSTEILNKYVFSHFHFLFLPLFFPVFITDPFIH